MRSVLRCVRMSSHLYSTDQMFYVLLAFYCILHVARICAGCVLGLSSVCVA